MVIMPLGFPQAQALDLVLSSYIKLAEIVVSSHKCNDPECHVVEAVKSMSMAIMAESNLHKAIYRKGNSKPE